MSIPALTQNFVFETPIHKTTWKESLGSLFPLSYFNAKKIYKITLGSYLKDNKVILATCLIALIFLFPLLKYSDKAWIKKAFLNCSDFYKKRFLRLQNKILKKELSVDDQILCELIFEKATKQWSFLEGILEEYKVAINSPSSDWSTKRALNFLQSELLILKNNIDHLERQVIALDEDAKNQLNHKDPSHPTQQLSSLSQQIESIKKEHEALLQNLKEKFFTNNYCFPVRGLKNDGNTCYINSALQPLLAIQNFPLLIPEKITKNDIETPKVFEGRKDILAAFKKVIESYKNQSSPRELGSLIGKLRSAIFKAQLDQGGFIEREAEGSFQDAGSFFELILHVIGQEFKVSNEKKFTEVEDKVIKNKDMCSILFLKQQGSVQEKINYWAKPQTYKLEKADALRHKDLALTEYIEKETIISAPPALLVLRVENYRVKVEADSLIDCSLLFGEQTCDETKYELVGFSQNHHQVHWTAVVKSLEGWNYCNDSTVLAVNPEEANFTQAANYLIYQRKTSD